MAKKIDDRVAKTILLIFAILIIIGFSFAFNLNVKANESRKLFEKEMAFRLDMEEQVSKLRTDKMELTTILKNRDLEIKQRNELIAELNKVISDKEDTIAKLQLELKGMTLLKEQLENSLKTELSKEE